MKFPETARLGATVHWLGEAPSTNVTLEAMWRDDPSLPHETLVVTASQTAGRGRLGRGWEMPPGKALAVSMLVRGFRGMLPTWLPLITGSAVVRATQPWFPDTRIAVKWPNDVHAMVGVGQVPGADPANPSSSTATAATPRLGGKLNGILCQLVDPETVIVGVGTNLFLDAGELPTERAGSWLTEGAHGTDGQPIHQGTLVTDGQGARLADAYLAAFVTETRSLIELAQTNPNRVIERIIADSATIGTRVRVFLPGGVTLHADAVGLTGEGALRVRTDDGVQHTVHAGDVEHLREG